MTWVGRFPCFEKAGIEKEKRNLAIYVCTQFSSPERSGEMSEGYMAAGGSEEKLTRRRFL